MTGTCNVCGAQMTMPAITRNWARAGGWMIPMNCAAFAWKHMPVTNRLRDQVILKMKIIKTNNYGSG